ncbi:SDR family oxidoreductase [Aeromonas allosaccharophila]|uniref:UDP-glucose 4-epimerase family protein n=1 Tax=Aeromonas allosaccharophila TaxID=656 RepID=UPI001BCE8AB7|nr:SDR family oxidoreductase [Aeromonas allosaccharophila]MBS4697996.1 SDR family oxidoreductase [Aeromonas allosaccharophila]
MILLTGATGFVGNAVFKRLIEKNYPVRIYSRRAPANIMCDSDYVLGDIDNTTNYEKTLESVNVIIHCAAKAHLMEMSQQRQADIYYDVNVEGTLNLARQALAAGVKRFIFISSIKVNGEFTVEGASFNHLSPAAPEDDYARSKQLSEERLQALTKGSGMELVVIRPPLVYGPGVKGNFSSLLMVAKRNLPLPFGAIHNRRSMVALDNLVDIIITCIDHPKAANQIFLVSDDNDISTMELLNTITRTAGKSPRLIPVPISWLRMLGRLTGKQSVIERLCGNLQVDISHTKHTLSWQPPISVAEGIQRCFIEEE